MNQFKWDEYDLKYDVVGEEEAELPNFLKQVSMQTYEFMGTDERLNVTESFLKQAVLWDVNDLFWKLYRYQGDRVLNSMLRVKGPADIAKLEFPQDNWSFWEWKSGGHIDTCISKIKQHFSVERKFSALKKGLSDIEWRAPDLLPAFSLFMSIGFEKLMEIDQKKLDERKKWSTKNVVQIISLREYPGLATFATVMLFIYNTQYAVWTEIWAILIGRLGNKVMYDYSMKKLQDASGQMISAPVEVHSKYHGQPFEIPDQIRFAYRGMKFAEKQTPRKLYDAQFNFKDLQSYSTDSSVSGSFANVKNTSTNVRGQPLKFGYMFKLNLTGDNFPIFIFEIKEDPSGFDESEIIMVAESIREHKLNGDFFTMERFGKIVFPSVSVAVSGLSEDENRANWTSSLEKLSTAYNKVLNLKTTYEWAFYVDDPNMWYVPPLVQAPVVVSAPSSPAYSSSSLSSSATSSPSSSGSYSLASSPSSLSGSPLPLPPILQSPVKKKTKLNENVKYSW